ncbi:MAG: hypothetical protein ABIT76_10700 [Chthoniobacterales bacterium]
MVTIWFSPWWLGGRVLAPLDLPGGVMQPWAKVSDSPAVHNHFVTDAVTQYLPYRLFAEKSYREDGYIGWCSLTFQGFPQDANTMGLFSDWTMQLHRGLPFWTAWHLGLAGQFLIAGCGMLYFLRQRGASAPAAWAGAMAWMGNAQFVIWIYHRWALSAFCWLPWVLWSLDRAVRSKKMNVSPAIFLSLAFCGGTLQHAAFISLAYGIIALGLVIEGYDAPLRRIQLLRLTLWFVAGLGLAAFYLIPATGAFWQNLQLGNLRGQLGYAGGWRQPFLNLVSYPMTIFPWVLGRVSTLDLWKLGQMSLIDLGWFGFGPTLIAVLAIFWKKTPLTPRLLMIAGWVIPLTPLVGPLYHRVILLSVLGGVWSFCCFLENDRSDGKFSRWSWKIAGIAVLLWLAASIGIASYGEQIYRRILPAVLHASTGSQFGIFTDWTADRTRRFLLESVIWSGTKIPWVASALITLALVQKWSRLNHLRWLLGMIIAMEVSLFFMDWTTWSPMPATPANLLPYSKLVDRLSQEVRPGQLLYQAEVGPLYLSGAYISKLLLPPNSLMPRGIPVLTGYESIMPPRIWQNRQFVTSPEVLSEIGVTHVLLPADQAAPLGWSFIFMEEGRSLWRNPSAQPYYSAWAEGVTSPVTIEPSLQTENHRLLPVGPHTTQIHILENWNSGWRYRVASGNWIPVQKGSDGSQVLRLPKLDSATTVEMRYFPQWFGWPGIVSACTAGWLILLKVLRREPRKKAQN